VPRYVLHYPVTKRQDEYFTKEEIEMAAKVAFVGHPPESCDIPKQEFQITWSEDYSFADAGAWLIRVVGEVTEL
jgi:hypothetical protein